MWQNKLPPLQEEIIKLLGKKGALTKNEMAERLKKAYKNVLFAVNSLKQKGLIEVVGKKDYQRRTFETFWLTPKGFIKAYALGVSLSELKKPIGFLATKNVEEQKAIDILFEFMQAFGRKKAEKLLDMIDFDSKPPRLIGINVNIVTPSEAKKLLQILGKTEPYKSMAKKALTEALEALG